MRIVLSCSPCDKQSTDDLTLVRPGQGEGPSPDLFRWELGDGEAPWTFTLPVLQKMKGEPEVVAAAQVILEPNDVERAARHAAALAPFDYLAGKVAEEEEEFILAVEAYRFAQGRHGKNEAWSHLMSESADVANTTAAWLLRRLPAQTGRYGPTLVYAVAFHVAIRLCHEVLWVDHTGTPVQVGGRRAWVTQRLLDDVAPVAEAVFAAAVAKTAEVAVRPHRGWKA